MTKPHPSYGGLEARHLATVLMSQSFVHLRSAVFVALLLLGAFALLRMLQGSPHEAAVSAVPSRFAALENADSSCRSRREEGLIRGGRSNIGALHAETNNQWTTYKTLFDRCVGRQWINSNDISASDPVCKYVVFLDAEDLGLGNRLMALVSAMAFALATDRILLIDNSRKLADLLCEPSYVANGSSWVIPQEFLTSLVSRSVEFSDFTKGTVQDKQQIEVVKVNLWDEPRDDQLSLFCETHYSSLSRVAWVTWRSDLYTIPNLFLVPSFWERMRALRATPEASFALISRFVLFPSDRVWAIALRAYVAYLSGAMYFKGIQVRPHGTRNLAAFEATTYAALVNCITSSGFLPRPNPEVNATQIALHDHVSGHVEVAVLVASLDGHYIQGLRQMYFRNGASDGSVLRMHSVSSLQKQDFTTRQSEFALAEMWLLSFTDQLTTSASSTFGYTAHAWGGIKPLVVDFSPSARERGTTCVAGYSSDPCSHLPRCPSCFKVEGLGQKHQQWIRSHLRACQDRPTAGWQLVGNSVSEDSASPVLPTT